ncbi:Protein of unknown function [Paraburkholderia steynii]|uniref:DUF1364 domain-containing protein n=1 Tax=Paraburkholderia steynii TaxID=1245441 RepID=A0A7Z7BC43_9BURK|nr:nuclease domain-containing protein [Paraburkholderia steynii]SDI65010.1 Protein of unknown function [Paraburkholderia steynii]
MKRSGFVRKPGKVYATLTRATPMKSTCSVKVKRKRVTKAEGSDYLAACRGESCYLRVPGVCCGRIDTVVPCHSNQSKHGKGMGIKAKHEFTVPGCLTCHAWLDQGDAPRETKVLRFDAALDAWVPVRAEKMGMPMLEFA